MYVILWQHFLGASFYTGEPLYNSLPSCLARVLFLNRDIIGSFRYVCEAFQ